MIKDVKYLNYEVIKTSDNLMSIGHILFQDVRCYKMTAEVFQRYTDILVGRHPNFKGDDYDDTIAEFIALSKRLNSLHSKEDDEMFEEYNAFAKEQCGILYKEFINKPFDSEL